MKVLKRSNQQGGKNTKRLKAGRLSMRIDAFAKARLERAAAYAHRSVSDYVVSRALEAAETDISTHEKQVLPETIWDDFFHALRHPPKPNAAMRALLKEHDHVVVSR